MTDSLIYIIDDEETIREGLSTSLEVDYQVKAFVDAEQAIGEMHRTIPDLVLLDVGLPGMNGIEALREIKRSYPEILIIMITAYEDLDTVISAMKLGAYDYVVKPIHMDGLEVTIKNALESIKLRKEVRYLQEQFLKENLPYFVGESNAIQDVMDFIKIVAKSPDTPILILGETGTGKELIASAIHYRSPNFKGPLITVNCASIPKDLIESELFGYEKGAFTGASTSGKKGLLAEAADGTLFLDEVGDLSLEAQAKLLRFLEEGEFYRVGGTKKLRVKTRVVSATNKNLDLMRKNEMFREDLYFRLGVIKVQVPSLNKRSEDIIPLTKHFIYEFSQKFEKTFTGITPKAVEALMAHKWRGNIRELKNLIERAVLVGIGPKITVQDFGLEEINKVDREEEEIEFPPIPPTGIDIASLEKNLEKFYIEEAFKMAHGNESEAARLLKMNHHTYRYRRKKLKMERY